MKKHQTAIEEALTDLGLAAMPAHRPLVELCRTLAQQMDAAGTEPSTRLTAAYLSALKDVRRAAGEMPPKREPGKLAELRAVRGRPEPTKKGPASRLRRGAGAER